MKAIAVVQNLLLAVAFCSVANASEYDELCPLFKDGMTLRKPGSCTEYINCNNQKAQVYSCSTPTNTYDRNTQACVVPSAAAGSGTGSSTDLCRNRCEDKSGEWIADPVNCNGFYYCHNGGALASQCPHPLHFNESQQACLSEAASNCVQMSSMCELVPDGTKFRNDKNCNKYYECTKGVVIGQDCKKEEYFDVEAANCKARDMVYCTAHPIPPNICNATVGARPDQATCYGYYRCRDLGIVEDLEPTWTACPKGLFFDANTERCLEPIHVVCKHNRCHGRGEMLVQSSSHYCHNYIRCKDDFPLGEEECPNDRFFDEITQTCTTRYIEYAACDKQK